MKEAKKVEFKLELIEDKVEFFEASSIQNLEKQIQQKIDQNKAIMLSVHHISHQIHTTPEGKPIYTAVVHYKLKS